MTVELEDRRGVTETAPGVEALTSRHPAEISQLATVAIFVRADSDQWWREDRGKPRQESGEWLGPPTDSVRIRVSQYGTTLTVEGEDRTGVEGLAQRLAEIMGRAATNSPGFPREALPLTGLLLGTAGFWLGVAVVQWLGLAENNDKWDTAETLGAVGGVLIGVAVAVGIWWLFPPVEIFDEGGAGRARRFRVWIFATAGALFFAVAGSALYDLFG